MIFQCAKLLLAIGPASISREVREEGEFRRRHRWRPLNEEIAGWDAIREGEQLQPLVAAARHVKEVASSLTQLYNFILMVN
jgi:hypothetical protein